jgi:hypothetical protein
MKRTATVEVTLQVVVPVHFSSDNTIHQVENKAALTAQRAIYSLLDADDSGAFSRAVVRRAKTLKIDTKP